MYIVLEWSTRKLHMQSAYTCEYPTLTREYPTLTREYPTLTREYPTRASDHTCYIYIKQMKVTKYYSPVCASNPSIDATFLFGNKEVKIYTSHMM